MTMSTAIAEVETSCSTDTAETATSQESNEHSVAKMAKVLQTTLVDGKKSVWAMTKETLGMAEGKTKHTDLIVDNEEEALQVIRGMVRFARESEMNKRIKTKWDIPWTPLKEMDATLDDMHLSFCRWARKADDGDQPTASINVSKAFRRFESYVSWMYDARKDLLEPLTVDSIRAAAAVLPMKLTHDTKGRLVWWIDVKELKTHHVSVQDAVRYMVWLTHVCMLDKGAQENGLVLVQGLEDMTFWKMMKLFPMEVSTKMDRLTIGVMPIKMKAIYVLYTPKWVKLLTGMMAPFMSKKMRQRSVHVKTKQQGSFIEDSIGPKRIVPKDCCGLRGTLEKDIVVAKYLDNSPL